MSCSSRARWHLALSEINNAAGVGEQERIGAKYDIQVA
jgi:hypothetical protein